MNIEDYTVEKQMSWSDLGGVFGKMSQAHSQATTGRTSESSLKKRYGSQTKMPLFLDLRGNGHPVDALWERDIQLLGEFMMPSTGEFHRDAEDYVFFLMPTDTRQPRYCLNLSEKPMKPIPTKLSDILEENADPKYNLSARACQGILNRAQKRGKTLPEILQRALENQVV